MSNLAGQTTVSDLPEINATDALQTWDLYSWINDLANIKDAYSFDPQVCGLRNMINHDLAKISSVASGLQRLEFTT